MMLTIRDAAVEDTPIISELIRAAYEEYRGNLVPPSSAHGDSEEVVRGKLATARALIGEMRGRPVASVLYEPVDGRLYFFRLAVHPEFRRCGIAAALICRLEEIAAEEGLESVYLGARLALPANLRLYERLGYRFVKNGERLHEGQVFYVLLEKPCRK